jgi:hypothetical protein
LSFNWNINVSLWTYLVLYRVGFIYFVILKWCWFFIASIWGLTIYSRVDNTCTTASCQYERRFGVIKLVSPLDFLFTDVIVPNQKGSGLVQIFSCFYDFLHWILELFESVAFCFSPYSYKLLWWSLNYFNIFTFR